MTDISEPQIYHQLAASPTTSSPSSDTDVGTTEKGSSSTESTTTPQKGHPAQTSILLTTPFNIFTGIYRSFPSSKIFSRFRSPNNNSEIYPTPKGQTLTFHVSLATLLAKFTPILLSNIPFSNAVTWKIHEACTWLSVAFLSYMVLVLVVSLVLPYKELVMAKLKQLCWWGETESGQLTKQEGVYMPLKADTIAANMYYLCHSERMARDFEGMLEMPTKERDKMVCRMGRRYFFGEVRVSCSCSSSCLGSEAQELNGKRKPSLASELARDTSVCTCKDGGFGNGRDKNKTVIGVGYC